MKNLLDERERVLSLYQYERQAWRDGFEFVAGVDEAGRGTLAGPVVVAAVILPHELFLEYLNDSKQVTEKRREILFQEIREKALCYSVSVIDNEIIDKINILQATKLGMHRAIEQLQNPKPEKILIDAVKLNLSIPSLSLIKGDSLSASIAAASILAKVTRDHLMQEYDKKFPEYGFAKHKGYGTKEHLQAIEKFGACPIHRLTFKPFSDQQIKLL